MNAAGVVEDFCTHLPTHLLSVDACGVWDGDEVGSLIQKRMHLLEHFDVVGVGGCVG